MNERRGELVGWLSLFLSRVARAAGGDSSGGATHTHQAVVSAGGGWPDPNYFARRF